MALPDPIPRREIILDVTSAALVYDVPFPFIFDMDVEVAVSTATAPDVFSRLTFPAGYTLTGAGSPIGGAVHLTAAPELGSKIRVRGISAENASEEVVRGIRYNYLSIENALLRASWGLQEANRDNDTLSDRVDDLADEVSSIIETVADAVTITTTNAATATAAAGAATAGATAAGTSAEAAAAFATTAQEIADNLAEFGVASFNGRNGAVMPTAGDYTPDQVGAVPLGRKLIGGTGVKLNGGTEASLAGDVTISVAGVPTGAVMGFDLAAPPVGWIVGDGSAINRHTYADLDAVKYCGDALNATATAWYRCTDPANPATTRSVTGDYLVTRDLRGVFPRFLDAGRGLDVGRELGSQQSDAIRNIVGATANGHGAYSTVSGAFGNASSSTKTISGSMASGWGTLNFDASRVVPTAAENRPVNIALLGCIKY